jgi:exodeoxyribonuclease-3
VLKWLEAAGPDVVLLQETKVEADTFPAEPIGDLGYNVAAQGEPSGRNGVAILSKFPIEDRVERLPGDPEDLEARWLEAFTGGVRVASVYVPNGTEVGSERFAFKLAFLDRMRAHAATLLAGDDPFVIGGDMNVAPYPIDVYDPEALNGTICYHPEERARYRALMHLGLYDAFRMVEPRAHDAYSWWHYQGRAWKANEGLRIDHLLLSPEAADRLGGAGIDREVRAEKQPSDHAPVWCALRPV